MSFVLSPPQRWKNLSTKGRTEMKPGKEKPGKAPSVHTPNRIRRGVDVVEDLGPFGGKWRATKSKKRERKRERERMAVEKKERKKERKSGLGNPEAVDASANYDATKRCRSETASASANWTVAVSRSAGRPEKKNNSKKKTNKKKTNQQHPATPNQSQFHPTKPGPIRRNPVKPGSISLNVKKKTMETLSSWKES